MTQTISLYIDVELPYGDHIYRFKDINVTCYSYRKVFDQLEIDSKSKTVIDPSHKPFYRYQFIGEIELFEEKKQYLVTCELPEVIADKVIQNEDYRILAEQTWTMFTNFGRDNFDLLIQVGDLTEQSSVIALDSMGKPYTPPERSPMKIPFVGSGDDEVYYYVATMVKRPDVGFIIDSYELTTNTEEVTFHFENGSAFEGGQGYINLPGGSYKLQGPMTKQKARKILKNLKKIEAPGKYQLEVLFRFNELMLDYQKNNHKKLSVDEARVIHNQILEQAKIEAKKYIDEINDDYVQLDDIM